MALTISSAKLTGNPGTSGWAQIHEFKPEDPEKLATRGHLFAVIATRRHEEGVDGVVAGRELLGRLHEEYFGKPEGEPFNILKSAVEKVIGEFSETWGEVEIAAVTFLGNVVYSAVGGGAEVAIFRNGMLAKILESGEGKVVSASGYPKEGDILLLGTKLFFDTIPNGVIKAALESAELATAVEQLAPSVHARSDTGSLGSAVIKFEKEMLFAKGPEPKKPDIQKLDAVRTGFKSLAGTVASKIEAFLKRFPERRIYVRGMPEEEIQPQSRKVTLTVGVILLAILLVSIGFGIAQKRLKDARGKYETRLTQAQHEIDEAVGLATLNPERARELFVSSRGLADALTSEGVKDPALAELVGKLDSNQGVILGEYKSDPQLFLDLSILSDGLSGDDLSGSSDKVFILDKKGKKIVGISLGTKKTEVVAGPDQADGALAVASYEDRVFILTNDGIFEVGDEKTKVVERQWEGEVLPYAYAGNLYLLDKSANMIWRYAGTGKTFGAKAEWLGPGVEPDFSKIISVSIDGSIWTLSQTGKILKFTQGSPQNISAAGTFPEIASADALYTNEELGFVYILDKQGKRVVVLEKDGKYKAQYLSDKISEATDLTVSEKEKKIILLAGSKLYSIELKHI